MGLKKEYEDEVGQTGWGSLERALNAVYICTRRTQGPQKSGLTDGLEVNYLLGPLLPFDVGKQVPAPGRASEGPFECLPQSVLTPPPPTPGMSGLGALSLHCACVGHGF